MTMSVFLLAYAIGPLFYGPLSEIYGRVIILQLSNAGFLIFNLACGFAQTVRLYNTLGGKATPSQKPQEVATLNTCPNIM